MCRPYGTWIHFPFYPALRLRLRTGLDSYAPTALSLTSMVIVRDSPGGATFQVRVHPRAKKNAIVGEVGEAMKLALTAPPVEGRANEACIAFLAELLNVPRSSVTIASGKTAATK